MKFRCEDFYAFVCGKYIQSHPVSNDSATVSEMNNISDKLMLELNETMYMKIEESEIETFKLSQAFFRSCMDTSELSVFTISRKFLINEVVNYRNYYRSWCWSNEENH